MTEFDDIYYLRLIRDGNTDAFVHIVRRYQRMIYAIVNKIVFNPVDAEDITQEIFIKVFKSLDKFREESVFSTWLYRIAYNTAISEVRKARGKFVSIDNTAENFRYEDISDDIDETAMEERLQYLDRVLKQLSPGDAMLISLYYMNNCSIEEISAISNLSQSNVKIKLYRIRKFMNFEINKLISK
ncbi:RNA polymerase sigma factor [Viscerimonas tarda]